jgi:UDP-galactopyranose mutase
MFDYLIVGAGFAGSVLAERLAAGSTRKFYFVTGVRTSVATLTIITTKRAF